jgi:hypothetical protein
MNLEAAFTHYLRGVIAAAQFYRKQSNIFSALLSRLNGGASLEDLRQLLKTYPPESPEDRQQIELISTEILILLGNRKKLALSSQTFRRRR